MENYIIKKLIDNNSYIQLNEYYKKIKEDELYNNSNIILYIEFLIRFNNYDKIIFIINNKIDILKKRELLHICNYLYNNDINNSGKLLKYTIEKYKINNINLLYLINNKLILLLYTLNNYYCQLELNDIKSLILNNYIYGPVNHIKKDLIFYEYKKLEINKSLDIIRNNTVRIDELNTIILNIKSKIKEPIYKKLIIIDGGNIIHSYKKWYHAEYVQ